MKIIDIQQGSPEWLTLRKNKIGASDSSSILGINPWTSPYQLWSRKLGLMPDIVSNDAMKKGTELEPVARDRFIRTTGINMDPIVAIHSDRDWQLASLDGWNQLNGFAVEIKCGGENLYNQACNEIIPEYYQCQMQHQMSVLGIDFMFYFVFFDGNGKILEIKRDECFITRMISEEESFWNRLQNLESPDLTDKDYILREDFEWKDAANNWKKMRSELKNLEEEEKKLRQRLIDLSGNSNSMGQGIKLSKVLRKGFVDYQKIPELNGVNLDLYRNPNIETFRIVESK